MQLCQQPGVDLIMRGSHDRRLAGEAGHLREALAQAPVLGQTTVEARAAGNRPARPSWKSGRCGLIWTVSGVRGGWQAALPGVTAVEVREVQAPPGVKEPLPWLLLTSLPCTRRAQAQRGVGRYAARWWIGEYPKALKSGARVEDSQLERGDRLEPLIAGLAVLAVRWLSTKMLARSRPESFEAAASFGPEMLALLEKKLGPPTGGWNNRNVLIATARPGGFPARQHEGLPGWQTIWRGWQQLMWMLRGNRNPNAPLKRCG